MNIKRDKHSKPTKVLDFPQLQLPRLKSLTSWSAIVIGGYFFMILLAMIRVKMPVYQLAFGQETSLFYKLVVWLGGSGFLYLWYAILKRESALYAALSGIIMALALVLIWETPKNVYLTVGIMAMVAISYLFLNHTTEFDDQQSTFTKKAFYVAMGAVFIIVVLAISNATIARYRGYGSSTYDFGIFTQMFEYMRTTGLPNTTIERNYFLSHFAVHFSPIYYLLLPGYMVFDQPEYLLVTQALAVAAVFIPTYKLARHYQMSYRTSALIAIAAMLLPALIAPTFFDFHENKFLTLLLLWVFYLYEKKSYKTMFLFVILSMFVKEDAPIYIGIFGVYVALARGQWRLGGGIFAFALTYFFAVTAGMHAWGLGIMDERFSNYQLPGESGLLVVFKNILYNPMYFVQSLFSEKKMQYILFTMGPLIFMPLVTKKWRRYVLLLPIVVNLMTTYPYQYEIYFQYTYAIAAFFLYGTIQNIGDLKPQWQQKVATLMVVFAIAFTFTATGDTFISYPRNYKNSIDQVELTNSALAMLPRNKTIATDTYFSPQLYRHKVLYENPAPMDADFVLIDLRQDPTSFEEKTKQLEEKGYSIYHEGGYVRVYKKP